MSNCAECPKPPKWRVTVSKGLSRRSYLACDVHEPRDIPPAGVVVMVEPITAGR